MVLSLPSMELRSGQICLVGKIEPDILAPTERHADDGYFLGNAAKSH